MHCLAESERIRQHTAGHHLHGCGDGKHAVINVGARRKILHQLLALPLHLRRCLLRALGPEMLLRRLRCQVRRLNGHIRYGRAACNPSASMVTFSRSMRLSTRRSLVEDSSHCCTGSELQAEIGKLAMTACRTHICRLLDISPRHRSCKINSVTSSVVDLTSPQARRRFCTCTPPCRGRWLDSSANVNELVVCAAANLPKEADAPSLRS